MYSYAIFLLWKYGETVFTMASYFKTFLDYATASKKDFSKDSSKEDIEEWVVLIPEKETRQG